jgi:3',5'-cyclic AMP phosphodiesterase CpdA
LIKRVDKKEIYLDGIRSVVVLGDNGCRPPTRESIAAFSRILKIKTNLFIILGDLVLKETHKEFRDLRKFCRRRTKTPIYTLAGNHDLPGYSKSCGSSTYAIILDNFGFICLDNSKRKFNEGDVTLLERVLKKHKKKKFFILFHIPPPLKFNKSHIEYAEWEKIKRVLDRFKQRVPCIFSGHIHSFLDYRLDGYRIIITGGGGATLFNLKQDRLNAHHALKLSSLDTGQIQSDIIPVDRIRKHRKVRI